MYLKREIFKREKIPFTKKSGIWYTAFSIKIKEIISWDYAVID